MKSFLSPLARRLARPLGGLALGAALMAAALIALPATANACGGKAGCSCGAACASMGGDAAAKPDAAPACACSGAAAAAPAPGAASEAPAATCPHADKCPQAAEGGCKGTCGQHADHAPACGCSGKDAKHEAAPKGDQKPKADEGKPGAAGQRVFLDPETGEAREPSPADIAAEEASRPAADAPRRAPAAMPVAQPGGGVGMAFPADLAPSAKARIDDAGVLVADCER